ncbi:unnamed protein product [Schistocephalus solidus]|uniref:DPPIV_N domain-containing protein n=1 Tax=Schistocephalus solidus TaxID=70667 RepID=A0A183T596_SCHSO|nr:unnamed protein product [Schistocephalus solidus]
MEIRAFHGADMSDPDRRVLARVDISPYSQPADPPLLNHASFSSEAKAIAFVHKNQLYYIRNPLTVVPHEVVNVTAPIFTEGVLYGFAGFLYEEEILGTSKTFWWSPDSSKLAFTAIDERNVSKTKLFFYEVAGRLDGEVVDHSYPKLVPVPSVREERIPLAIGKRSTTTAANIPDLNQQEKKPVAQ